MSSQNEIAFLQWVLPKLGYRWDGYRKPRNQVLNRICERLHELELTGGYEEYREYLNEHREEWEKLDRLCDVTISKFFRDRKVWEFMRDHLLPDMINKKTVSIWSAGCCNGEEAYSLAVICEQLILKDDREPDRNTVKILATDRNPAVLKRAREGRYPAGALKEMTNEEINLFFREINGNGNNYLIEKRLKRTIEFEQRDIGHSIPERIFNLVLCRNLVFTYFTEERQARFLDRLKPHLAAGGYLVTGSNESLPKTDWLKTESKTHCVFKAGSK